MALNFPINPSINDQYVYENRTYVYNGIKWSLFEKDYSYHGKSVEVASSTATIDLLKGNLFDISISANISVVFDNPPAAGLFQKFEVLIRVGAESLEITWPEEVIWETLISPTIPEMGQTMLLTFITYDAGNSYYGKLGGNVTT